MTDRPDDVMPPTDDADDPTGGDVPTGGDGPTPGDGQEQPSPTDRTAPGRTVPLGAFVVAVLAALALGVLVVVALAIGGDDDTSAADEARLAAARFADSFLSFSHDDLATWKANVQALSTRGFAEEVDGYESSIAALLESEQVRARAHVTEVYLSSIDNDSATAIVRYDHEISDARGDRLHVNGYTRFDMVKTEADWLVEDVYSISAADPLTAFGGDPPTPPTDDPEAEDDDRDDG